MATAFKLDDDLSARVERLADQRGQSTDAMLREVIDDFVTQADFLAEAQASWEDYQRSGLHLTLEEVEDWLSSWGTDHEKPMPECHK